MGAPPSYLEGPKPCQNWEVTQLRWGCVHTSPHGTAPNWSASRWMKRCIMAGRQNYVVQVNRLRERLMTFGTPGRVGSASGYRMIITPRHHAAFLLSTISFISCHHNSKHRFSFFFFFHGRRRAVSRLDISSFVSSVRRSRLSPTSKGEATPEAQAQQFARSRSLAPP